MLLVGQGSVGKTSLVNMLIEGKCDPAEKMTDGIEIRQWGIEDVQSADDADRQIRLNVWDFGGQEIMHATHQFFLSRRSLYLVVLDARQSEDDGRLQYWLNTVESLGGGSPIIIVLNKSDECVLDIAEPQIRAAHPQVRAIVRTACLGSVQESSGNGIDNLRQEITAALDELSHMRDVLPDSWFRIKERLEASGEDYLREDQYADICTQEGVHRSDDQDTLIHYLNDLGTVLTFKDDPRLDDTSILNPEWVTKGIYRILTVLAIQQTQGILELARLDEILDRNVYPKNRHSFLLGMMRKFELCFQFESDDTAYLLPDLLPRHEPDFGWSDSDSLLFEYHYNFLPGHVISRFIVRMSHHFPQDKQAYWRTGIFLRLAGTRTVVRADSEKARVTVAIVGELSDRRRALAVVRDSLDSIHASIPVLDAEAKVPVPGERCDPVPYEFLLQLESEGKVDFPWPRALHDLNVRRLLDGVDTPMVTNQEPLQSSADSRISLQSGVSYLASYVVLFASLVVGSQYVEWYALPLVLIGTILSIVVLLAVQLRASERLSDKRFAQLMLEVLRRLVLMRQ